ncbi:uncharacterized protein LOC141906126 [Tubulanus polymorphus]|uniref:uncharacterized protein LOC141906126 n=1 Tax=Tubulanus polymorphus TaxID=672921 RepID=UPI003DA66B50
MRLVIFLVFAILSGKTLAKYSFKNCDNGPRNVSLENFSIDSSKISTDDFIELPGTYNISATFSVNEPFDSIDADVTMRKHYKGGQILTISCYKNTGSCFYEDIYGSFNQTGSIVIDKEFDLPVIAGSSGLFARGFYELTVKLLSDSQQVGCFVISADVR